MEGRAALRGGFRFITCAEFTKLSLSGSKSFSRILVYHVPDGVMGQWQSPYHLQRHLQIPAYGFRSIASIDEEIAIKKN
jgi:hypothetical protein